MLNVIMAARRRVDNVRRRGSFVAEGAMSIKASVRTAAASTRGESSGATLEGKGMVTIRRQHGGQKSLEFRLRQMGHHQCGVGGNHFPAGITECSGKSVLADGHLFSVVFLEDGKIAFC